jgi:hypothetical protein
VREKRAPALFPALVGRTPTVHAWVPRSILKRAGASVVE